MPSFEWIKPPWQQEGHDESEDGCWPWVGDPFLAALRVGKPGAYHWEYAVLRWSEDSLECNDEPWGYGPEDVEWIARIPEPAASHDGD